MKTLKNLKSLIATHPLTREAQAAAWLRFASWQIASRLHGKKAVAWIGDQRLVVHRGMTGATGNIYVGLHEFADMMFPLHFLREGDLFVDVGANIGSYSVLASGVCRSKTLAFEPDPMTAVYLRENVDINSLQHLVTVQQIALGAEAGSVDFTVGLDTVNHVVPVSELDRTDTRSIEQRRLDDVLDDAKPTMMKLDVEGYEEQVLRGAAHALAAPQLEDS